ncbi:MAG: hypothetical protein K6G88_10175 [Lachnospiraceae bacterium]|nr:hypothetical protein [Lachnospiraceae bacterium]
MRLKKLAGIMIVSAMMTIGFTTVANAQTFELTAKTNVVDSITTTNVMSEALKFNWENDGMPDTYNKAESIYRVLFTLDKPAFVHVNMATTVRSSEFWGYIQDVELQTKSGIKIADFNESMTSSFAYGATRDKYVALEKGTYAVTYVKTLSSDMYQPNGEVTTIIDAKYIDRTNGVDANIMSSAMTLVPGVQTTGVNTITTKDQYYKLVLNKKSEVSFDVSVATDTVFDSHEVSYKVINDQNVNFTESFTKTPPKNTIYVSRYMFGGGYLDSGNTGTVTLPAGTYYFVASTVKDTVGLVNVKANVKAVPEIKTISKLKVTAKKNTKKVTIKTIAKAKVTVKIGKKKYTKKTNSKGTVTIKTAKLKKGTKVKVTVSKAGYKTKSKTVKVK